MERVLDLRICSLVSRSKYSQRAPLMFALTEAASATRGVAWAINLLHGTCLYREEMRNAGPLFGFRHSEN